MMRIINIKGCKTCKQVLLFRDRDDDGDDYVTLIAWHETSDGVFIQTDDITPSEKSLIKNFIIDFSEFAANEYANSFKL